MRPILLSLAVACVLAACALAQVAATTPATSTAPAAVPAQTISRMQALFAPPRSAATTAEAQDAFAKQWKQVLELGKHAERDYPAAPNLSAVRMMMLRAAFSLASTSDDPAVWRQELSDVAQRVLDSPAQPSQKVTADFLLLRARLGLDSKTASMPADAEDQIRALVRRYENTEGAVEAREAAVVLARQAGQAKLAEQWLDELAKGAQTPEARSFLREQDYFVGKPFEAKLELADGKTLALPDDLKGKIVVVDFWASWCGPCVVSTPALKELYRKYQPQGVEFVGISLDDNATEMQRFVRAQGLTWPQGYSGRRFDDPTARRYGVEAIPATWVLDREGKVLAHSLHPAAAPGKTSQLEDAIVRALAASSTTRPATTH